MSGSEDFVLVSSQANQAVSQQAIVCLVLVCRVRELAVEGFIHHYRPAHVDSLDLHRTKFADLLPDEVLVPPRRVSLLLRKTHIQAEIAQVLCLAIVVQGLEKFKGHAVGPVRERHVQVELDLFEVHIAAACLDHALLVDRAVSSHASVELDQAGN